MHEVDDGLDGTDRRLGEDAVAEVEDVTGLSAGLLEDARRVLFGEVTRAEQDGRVEVSLHGDLRLQGVAGEGR